MLLSTKRTNVSSWRRVISARQRTCSDNGAFLASSQHLCWCALAGVLCCCIFASLLFYALSFGVVLWRFKLRMHVFYYRERLQTIIVHSNILNQFQQSAISFIYSKAQNLPSTTPPEWRCLNRTSRLLSVARMRRIITPSSTTPSNIRCENI